MHLLRLVIAKVERAWEGVLMCRSEKGKYTVRVRHDLHSFLLERHSKGLQKRDWWKAEGGRSHVSSLPAALQY